MNRIKESFDSLPIAVCFFNKQGVVRLINHKMLSIASQLRNGSIQMLDELLDALASPPSGILCTNPELKIYQFPDKTMLAFTIDTVATKAGRQYTQVSAFDVTNLMQKQNQLKEENARLADANNRLKELFDKMPQIIREEETLQMKLRVHDDIGHSILAARRALLNGSKLSEIKANALLWEQSILVLNRSNQMQLKQSPIELAINRAGEIGVDVLLDGDAPKTSRALELAALAIRECAANCNRHANGTKLFVCFKRLGNYINITLTNNGTPPKAKIREGGGLSMLRHLVEEAYGSMEIKDKPNFKLILKLPDNE